MRLSAFRSERLWGALASMLLVSGCYAGLDGEGPGAGEGAGDDADDGADGAADGGDGVGAECGQTMGARAAPIRRMTDVQYRNTIEDLFGGLIEPSAQFPETVMSMPYSSYPEANPVTQLGAENILAAAEDVAAQTVENLAAVVPCADGADPSACADEFIDSFGRRAFRRPLRPDERALLRGLYDGAVAESDFPDAIGRLVTAVLQMPQFLYLVEEGEPTEDDGVLALTSYEVASRLSYLLWDTMPDDALLDAAEGNGLGTPEEIEAQARRLLADPRAEPMLSRFSRQWLEVGTLTAADKNAEVFPAYDDTLAAAMNEEFDRFVVAAYRSGEGSLQRLLSGSQTVVNAPLAALYQVDSGSSGPDDWQPVRLDDAQRKGVLTLPAVLAAHAGTAHTSAIVRGTMVRTQALCQELPPPPAELEIPEFPDDMSEREKSEVLLGNPTCAGCHTLINPLGLGLEHYDAIGAWRDRDDIGQPVDASGEIIDGPMGLTGTFNGGAELGQLLADADASASCMTLQWLRYTYGRRETPEDRCVAEAITEHFAASGDDLMELVVAFTLTEGFRYRRIEAES